MFPSMKNILFISFPCQLRKEQHQKPISWIGWLVPFASLQKLLSRHLPVGLIVLVRNPHVQEALMQLTAHMHVLSSDEVSISTGLVFHDYETTTLRRELRQFVIPNGAHPCVVHESFPQISWSIHGTATNDIPLLERSCWKILTNTMKCPTGRVLLWMCRCWTNTIFHQSSSFFIQMELNSAPRPSNSFTAPSRLIDQWLIWE